jgi:putative hydrolase of the HAD superfamily
VGNPSCEIARDAHELAVLLGESLDISRSKGDSMRNLAHSASASFGTEGFTPFKKPGFILSIPAKTIVKMKKATAITCLFLDVGGVLLTDGWDVQARKRAADHFKLRWADMEERHRLNFETYEEGKLSLDEYLSRVIFCERRSFARAQFRRFMFAQSQPDPKMLALALQLKVQHGLKIVVVSNEARELNSHRIRKFKLNRFVDAFVSSCFVHLRKPDLDIFRMALDLAQTPPRQIVYIDNTQMFVEIAKGFGIHGVVHTNYRSTRAKLDSFGLSVDERGGHENS